MSLDPSKRLRFGGSKSRNGCLTCIARHLKCDEGQPSCQRCIKAGRTCKQRSSVSEDLKIVQYNKGSPSMARSLQPDADAIEQRHFEFFRTRTAPEMSSVHYHERWLAHLFRVAYNEPAIYHAAAAVGALHENFEQGLALPQPMNPVLQQPLRQYTKAINKLMEAMNGHGINRDNQDTALLACLMFCAFESMSYHLHSALSHLHSGLKILAERAARGRSEYDTVVPCAELTAMFSRMNIQLLELGDGSFNDINIRLSGGEKDYRIFGGVPYAQQTFNPLLNNILHKIHNAGHLGIDVRTVEEGTRLSVKEWLVEDVVQFAKWNDLFDDELATWVQAASRQDICSLIVLQMRRMVLALMLWIDLKRGEMDFDEYLPLFEMLVQLGEEFICQVSIETSPSSERLQGGSSDPEDARQAISAAEKLRTPSDGTRNIQSGFLVVHPSQTPLADHAFPSTNRLVSYASIIVSRSRQTRQREDGTLPDIPKHVKPTFSLAHGVVFPLYTVGSRCRDPKIRRRALHLLSRCNRREGLWDAALAARLCKNLVDIEESRTLQLLQDAAAATWIAMDDIAVNEANQIPNSARVRVIRPSFLPERKSIERYYFSWRGPWEEVIQVEETWVEEIMEW
ncbi:hypothetical protein K431DRAFT_256944 [Polychaeton citri CBS 116435]|uniref:Zn(2)-C6 fungal-type domain-containing protein n=1 Tax=Polychaeton citri CBS 116435 TaxID=1314669 RepID=A0A9P4UKX6_9PEZI|nr:hypothetical protein K431DRAFT_256944 [Polychaeton citri CBS 116435]